MTWMFPSRACARMRPAGALALALLLQSASAHAVYRCELDGQLSYTDLPCPTGARHRELEKLAPPPPPAVSRQATGRSRSTVPDTMTQAREATELARLQQLRELRERQDQRIRDLAARGAVARDKKCRTLKLQLRWRDEDVRDANLRNEAMARKRQRRTEERYREECR